MECARRWTDSRGEDLKILNARSRTKIKFSYSRSAVHHGLYPLIAVLFGQSLESHHIATAFCHHIETEPEGNSFMTELKKKMLDFFFYCLKINYLAIRKYGVLCYWVVARFRAEVYWNPGWFFHQLSIY